MTQKLWIAAHHDDAHRNGGWAFVRADGAAVTGWAGGERRTTRARMTLTGFAAALRDIPAGAPLAVTAPRADALVLHTLLKPPDEPPADDGDLRETLAEALAGRTWTLAAAEPAGPTPTAFVAAWAETAAGKAKMGGFFAVAIPKANLTRIKGL